MAGASFQDGEVFDPTTPIADLPTPKTVPVVKDLPSTTLEILYYGQAPGLLAGVVQMNVRLPDRPARIPGHVDYLYGYVGDFVIPLKIWMAEAAGQ